MKNPSPPVHAFDRLASTNSKALELIEAGSGAPFWVLADEQTAGRGRASRSWESRPGNLYSSIALVGAGPVGRLPELAFVAAVSVAVALDTMLASKSLTARLKWPNDVQVNGRKIAGILIEGRPMATETATIIGIGINCVSHPRLDDYGATDLARETGKVIDRDTVFAELRMQVSRNLDLWDRGEGFSEIRQAWLDRAVGIGQAIVVRQPKSELTGIFEGLDPSGRLMLRLPTGDTQMISAGDVFVLDGEASDG